MYRVISDEICDIYFVHKKVWFRWVKCSKPNTNNTTLIGKKEVYDTLKNGSFNWNIGNSIVCSVCIEHVKSARSGYHIKYYKDSEEYLSKNVENLI